MSDHQTERRSAERQNSILNAKCRAGGIAAPDVWLTNLSASGCQLIVGPSSLAIGQQVVIELDGIDDMPGIVKWTLDNRAGVEFEPPLREAVVGRLLDQPGALAKASDRPLVDRFGRPMPELPRSRAART